MVRSRYDDIADFYIDCARSLDDPGSQALLALLGPVEDLRVLDVACGHGRLTRELARAGARNPTIGVDSSAALLSRAEEAELENPLGIRYIHADVSAPDWLDDETGFDAVTCHIGLSDIDDLGGTLRGISAALRLGGRFVFSILHPCFPSAEYVSGSWPADGSYYDEVFWTANSPMARLRRQVGINHRMLSTYINELHRHGLRLDAVAEPRPDEAWVAWVGPVGRHPLRFAARCLKA
ncbi:MAG TPA: class I SAM-dependent methyltransferase [Streptosporangiaceae bacterium]|nr:class I SAM-dependent methyltransferase [Streptosporangiaceae bacterium]